MPIEHRKRSNAAADWPIAKRMRIDGATDFPTAHRALRTDDDFRFPSFTNDAFTVGWICALEIELAASVAMLDEEFPNLPQILGDPNTYTLGRIGGHNVVLACLPAGTMGTNAAAAAVTNMMRSFPNIRHGLMVGIGGGVPDMPSNDPSDDIRLGDVVVGCPTANSSGVLQYDLGKTMRQGKFVQTGSLNKTSIALRTGMSALRARHRMEESQIPFYIDTMLQSNEKMREHFDHPGLENDQLFRADYDHIQGESSCEICDKQALLLRKPRSNKHPVIHYGLIGSANQVMRDGVTREKLRRESGFLCFEMEAAGLMDSLPCLVIRGICDYADSHKDKRWQPYAAAAAAAYAKEILSITAAAEATSTSTTSAIGIREMLRSAINESSLEQLFDLLPVEEQNQHSSAIPRLDPDDPKCSWIFKNIDYKLWRSNDGPLILCLSSSFAHHLSQVSSYIVSKEEEANRPVLYCFCSHVANGQFAKSKNVESKKIPLASALIYTLLGQIVRFSPIEKKALIMREFINGLLQKTFEKKTIGNWTGQTNHHKDLSKSLRNLLSKAAMGDLLSAFRIALDYTNSQPSFVVLDGVEKAYQGGRLVRLIAELIGDLRRQNSNIKILLAGPTPCDITSLSQESLRIEHDKERRDCLSSLQFENTRYEKISPEHGGSFEWVWTHPEYKSWSTPDTSRLLYIQGKPGSGKSTLTKYFDSKILREPNAKCAVVAKFFYSFREGELQRSHYNMLLSLLFDILYQDEAFFYHQCQTEYRAHQHYGPKMKWDYASLKKVLSSLQDYSTKKRFYLIVDAVDESEEADRRDILSLLYQLCSKMKHCVVKIFIASRPVAQLEARRDQFFNLIKLQDETTSDIFNYAHSLLDGLDFTHLLAQAIEYILHNAQGVFLWVKLVGKELINLHEDGYSEQEIFDFLKQLPTELKDVYARMLDKMKGNRSCMSYGLKMFRFILFAKRPLTVDELLHSLAIPDNLEPDPKLTLSDESFQKRVPSSERFIISCGGDFIEIKENDGKRIVQVIHQTVREFFLDAHGAVAKSEFRIDNMHAHTCIAITCIRYLFVCSTKTHPGERFLDDSWVSGYCKCYAQYLDEKPLACYALGYLQYHIDSCWKFVNNSANSQYLIHQFTADLAKDPVAFLLGSWAGSQLRPILSKYRRGKILLEAALGGFAVAVEALISAGEDIDFKDEFGRTPLSWAIGNGHEAVVKLLLANGAAIDIEDNFGRTPLSLAAENGQRSLARLLIQKGARVDTSDENWNTPLSWAARNGHMATVRMLLQHDARVDMEYKPHNPTAIGWAARNGHLAILKLLISKGREKRDGFPGMESSCEHKGGVNTADTCHCISLAWVIPRDRSALARRLGLS